MERLSTAFLWFLAVVSAAPGLARAQDPFLEPVGTFTTPVFATHAGDGSGRLFVVEQAGVVRSLVPGAPGRAVFLDIRDRVLSGGERGLLGLAFHPTFESNRRFFVNYTRDNDGATVIAEFTATPDGSVSTGVETILLTFAQPFSNHNGGMLAFGPDGHLYIGSGDGGSANDPGDRAQDTTTLLGKILRIDVDSAPPYSSPPTNPFVGTAGRDEIFAIGLRNPWRFSFDRSTGTLWVADVGQGSREEVSHVALGGNYGWRVFEGTSCTGLGPASCASPGFAPPVFEYPHSGGRCSITGGYAYRGAGSALPQGAYVYGDYCSGEIFTYHQGVQNVLFDTTLNVASFGEDESGEVYVVDLGGDVFRIMGPEPDALTFSRAGEGAGVYSGTGTPTLQTGSIRILPEAGADVPEAIAIIEQRSGGRLVSELAIAARSPMRRGRFPGRTGVGVQTGAAVMNPAPDPATVRFVFTDLFGDDVGEGEFVLPPYGQRAAFLEEALWGGPVPFDGAVTFDADSPVAVVALRARTNERGESLLAEAPVVDLDSPVPPGAERMPLLVTGGGYDTAITLVNRSDNPATGLLRAVGVGPVFNGSTSETAAYAVPPGTVQVVGTGVPGDIVRSGHLVIEPAVGAVPAALGMISLTTGGVVVSEAGTRSGDAVQAATLGIESAGAFGAPDAIRPAVAIVNAGPGSGTVDYTVFDAGGTLRASGEFEIPLEGQMAVFVHEIPGLGTTLDAGFLGTIRLEAATSFVALGLRARWNDLGEFLYATSPSVPESIDPNRYVPHFAVGGDYALRFIVYSASDSGVEGTIEFHDPEGGAFPPPVRP